VDEGGYLLYFVRPEESFAAGANVSIGKARTSAIFKMPTKDFEDTINKGRLCKRLGIRWRRQLVRARRIVA